MEPATGGTTRNQPTTPAPQAAGAALIPALTVLSHPDLVRIGDRAFLSELVRGREALLSLRLQRAAEAEPIAAEARALAERLGNYLDRVRALFLSGMVDAGRGRTVSAIESLEQVCREFDEGAQHPPRDDRGRDPFQQAAEREAITVELVRQLQDYLTQAPGVRFEASTF